MELGVEHITHLQWGKAKGRRTTVSRPDSCFLGFSISWRVPFHMKKTFLSVPIRSAGASVGVALPAKPFTSARRHHVLRPERTFLRPDVVPHPPQSLISSLGSTTSIGRSEPPATRTWCFTLRKALFLRPEAPRLSAGPSLRRLGRGASLPANPYSFVRKHHAPAAGVSVGVALPAKP